MWTSLRPQRTTGSGCASSSHLFYARIIRGIRVESGTGTPVTAICRFQTGERYCGMDDAPIFFLPASRSSHIQTMKAAMWLSVTSNALRPSALQNYSHVCHWEALVCDVRSVHPCSATSLADLFIAELGPSQRESVQGLVLQVQV